MFITTPPIFWNLHLASKGGFTGYGGKRRISKSSRIHAAKFSEVPAWGLKQLVEVLEGTVHMIEPFGSFRGTA